MSTKRCTSAWTKLRVRKFILLDKAKKAVSVIDGSSKWLLGSFCRPLLRPGSPGLVLVPLVSKTLAQASLHSLKKVVSLPGPFKSGSRSYDVYHNSFASYYSWALSIGPNLRPAA